MKMTDDEKIKHMLRSSEYLHEDDEDRKIPWFKLIYGGIVVWIVIIGITIAINQI